MYERSSHLLHETPTEAHFAQKAQKQLERRGRLPIKVGAAALALSSLIFSYRSDVEANQRIVEASSVAINTIRPKDDNGYRYEQDDTLPRAATIVADGFNAYDANYLTRTLAPALRELNETGPLFSISYSNASLDRENIASTVAESIRASAPDTVSFFGYSQGGVTSLEAAADLIHDPNVTIDSIIFASTPFGFEGLRPEQQEKIALGRALLALPGAEYSSAIRYVSELLNYSGVLMQSEQPFDVYAVGEAFEHANDRVIRNAKATTNSLLLQQILKIDSVDFAKEFETIASARGTKPLPLIVYLKTGPTGYDTVVDDVFSAQHICTAAEEAGLYCLILEVPDVEHGFYYQRPDAYVQTLSENKERIDKLIALNRFLYERGR